MENLPKTIIQEKREAWADVGEVVHNSEIELRQMANTIIAELYIPTGIEEIQKSEESLKIAKKKYNELVENRKKTTNPLDTVASRLMESEKSVSAKFPEVEKVIIALKKLKAEADNLKTLAENERKSVTEQLINHINSSDYNFRVFINSRIEVAYTYALGKGEIAEENLGDYLGKCLTEMKETNFSTEMPTINVKYITQNEVLVAWEAIKGNIKPYSFYIDIYYQQLQNKFEFYAITLKNKEEALMASKLKAQKEQEALEQEVINKEIASKLTAISTNIEIVEEKKTKALKSIYDLDMPETEESGLIIIASFVSNFNLTKQYVKASWFSLNVGQMGKALVSVKNKDEKFTCTGINFKKVDKL